MIGVAEPIEGHAVPDVANDGKVIQAYYDIGPKNYWIQNSRGGWIGITPTSLRRHLRGFGLRAKAVDGERMSEVDAKLNEIETAQDVAYAGPLAGHNAGLAECSGNRILITSSPVLLEPVEGDWPVLRAVLTGLLNDGNYDQREYVYGWLKIAYESLRTGLWRPGQVMAMAGPIKIGKSLLQKLITVILGGRVAKPYRYMTNGTQFNGDLFGAEHLMIEDEHSSTDIRARRNLGAQLKQFTVNETQSCHDKHRAALTLTPFWRVTMSLNHDPEAKTVLPPMSESEGDSLIDKVFLLRAFKAEMPMPTTGHEERALFWNTLVGELPAFLHFLETWEIPAGLRDSRFGIKTWHHPELLQALKELAPETRLLRLIDEVIFSEYVAEGLSVPRGPWTGTAERLARLLMESDFATESRRLLSWSNATGTYLGRLEDKPGSRVKSDRTSEKREWVITAPGRKHSLNAAGALPAVTP